MRALLEAGADVTVAADGSTPLHFAALLGAEDIAELLLGAAPGGAAGAAAMCALRDADGMLPAQLAAAEGHAALAARLQPKPS